MRASPKADAFVPVPDRSGVVLACVAAWMIPGAAHLLRGQRRKGLVFFFVLLLMDGLGVWLGGRLFPFDVHEPLVALAAASEWMMGAPRLIASMSGIGQGAVTAVTYEYGNTFLICAGLLNTLVVLDAFDIASGRKSA